MNTTITPTTPKPFYVEGEMVCFDSVVSGNGIGKIRGRAVVGPIDLWIVEVIQSSIDKDIYPWSCIVIPHICLKLTDKPKENKDNI